jgi:pimeloyl-ACP methyl ester carboxylesterase
MRKTAVTTTDGRRLAVYEDGDPRGRPVLAIYGTPSGGLIYERHAADARAQGIRLVTFDRPGYGGSDPRPGRSVGDFVADATAVADALELERLGIWGWSGGGPHALACAAMLGDRVAGVASLAAPAPYRAEGLDWIAGMGEDNVEEFGAALAGREALEPLQRRQADALAEGSPDDLRREWVTLLSPVDAEALTAGLAASVHANTVAALAPGVEGWLDDDLAFVEPWGFELDAITVPVQLWHGDHDLFVPPAHGRWLAERIPGVDARLSDVDGHLTLVEHRMPEVHAWLAEHL